MFRINPVFCINCKRYYKNLGDHLCNESKTDYVTGEKKYFFNYCYKKNSDGYCPDYEKKET